MTKRVLGLFGVIVMTFVLSACGDSEREKQARFERVHSTLIKFAKKIEYDAPDWAAYRNITITRVQVPDGENHILIDVSRSPKMTEKDMERFIYQLSSSCQKAFGQMEGWLISVYIGDAGNRCGRVQSVPMLNKVDVSFDEDNFKSENYF